jgi:ribosomal protein S18 acetylase RimI-like enzyme
MSVLNTLQFKGYDLLVNKGDESHLIEAYKGKVGPIAHLEWDSHTGNVKDVSVSPEHQRKGLATAMWSMASKSGLTQPVHSEALSEQGLKWKGSLK